MSWAGHVTCRRKKRNHTHFWWGNLKAKKRLEIFRRRWKKYSDTVHKGTGWVNVGCTYLTQQWASGQVENGYRPSLPALARYRITFTFTYIQYNSIYIY
jgi:hypothetical protein